MCNTKVVIAELFYTREAINWQTHQTCLDLGDKLTERLVVGYQDTLKVMRCYIDVLGGKYGTLKTIRKEKEAWDRVRTNNDPSS